MVFGRLVGGLLLRVRAVAVKEFWSLFRQPQLLLLLLVGPVLIMVAFALSFQVESVKPRAVVVVKPGSEGAELFREFRGQFTERTRFQGTAESVEAADELLREDRVDAVIIVPDEPSAAVARGEQAPITVHYRNINPIFGTTVPNRANGLILDLNQSIVRQSISQELDSALEAQRRIDEIDRQLDRIESSTGSLATEDARNTTAELDRSLGTLETTLSILSFASPEDGDISVALDQTRRTRDLLAQVREVQGTGDEAASRDGIAELRQNLSDVQQQVSTLPTDVPPSVLVNPFRLDLDNLAPFEPGAVGFYAPATLALLIQHISLSLASLAIVRERLSGAYEFFDVSPLGPGELLAGKFVTYAGLVLGVNLAVAGVLALALDIPVRGGYPMLAVVMTLLTITSLGVGFLVSALVRTQLQAIQVAMLSFIASGFFAGFLFPLEELNQPAVSVSYFLPATYGIRALQDAMIRGTWLSFWDLLGFVAISAVSLFLARYLMGRKRV